MGLGAAAHAAAGQVAAMGDYCAMGTGLGRAAVSWPPDNITPAAVDPLAVSNTNGAAAVWIFEVAAVPHLAVTPPVPPVRLSSVPAATVPGAVPKAPKIGNVSSKA